MPSPLRITLDPLWLDPSKLWLELNKQEKIFLGRTNISKKRKKKKKNNDGVVKKEWLTGDKGFPGDSAGKETICDAGDLGLIRGLGRASGEGKGYPLQWNSPGQRGCKELDMTEWSSLQQETMEMEVLEWLGHVNRVTLLEKTICINKWWVSKSPDIN